MAKYLNHMNFWDAINNNNNSLVWKELLRANPIALKA